jgi:cytidylate kinase
VLDSSRLKLQLSKSQGRAVKLLDSFLSGEEKIFILKGYAGTGKTTLLKLLIDTFQEYSISFYLCAPTGRAAKIISEKTGMKTSTIHKMIYSYSNIFTNEVLNDAQTQIKFYFALKKNNGLTDSVILIDEASLISGTYNSSEYISFGSGRLLHDLIKFFDPVKNNNKIIFIGDDAQLPPINSNISPALSVSYLKDEFGFYDIMETELQEVFRQGSGSEILSNATKIRDSIMSHDYSVFSIKANNYNIIKIDESNVANEYLNIKNNFVSDINENIVIAFSNKKAFIYNQDIRNIIFKKTKNKKRRSKIYGKSIQDIAINDILIITKNTYFHKEHINEDGEVTYLPVELYNGEFVRVLAVEPVSPENKKNILVSIDNKRKYVKLVFRDILIEYKNYEGNSSTIKIKIFENYLLDHEITLSTEQSLALYIDFVKRFKQKNKAELKRITSNVKDLENTELFRQEMRKDPFFNALLVKYGYAITCHKAQGGEWENVFVDFDLRAKNYSEYFYRWSYTAISRTKNKLYLINVPDYTLDTEQVIQDNYIVDHKMKLPIEKDNQNLLIPTYDKNLSIKKIYNKIPESFSTDNKNTNVKIDDLEPEGIVGGVFDSDRSVLLHNNNLLANQSINQELMNLVYSCYDSIETLEKIFKIPNNEILKLLFKELHGLTGSSKIFIYYIEHKTLVERYYFIKGTEIACIDFHFNKTNFSHIQPYKTNSSTFMEELKSLLETIW